MEHFLKDLDALAKQLIRLGKSASEVVLAKDKNRHQLIHSLVTIFIIRLLFILAYIGLGWR